MGAQRIGLYGAVALAGCLVHPVRAAEPATDNSGISEVVITAERHKSTVQDTPISISALSGDDLAARGLSTVEDVIHDVPGLSMRSAGPGQTEYEARGVASNGGSSPTVGFYLNDVPLSPPASGQTGKVVIDPDLYDVNHIEVLRGPQGTLYGSGSMAGTVRIATNPPKLDSYEGSVETIGSYTDGGGPNGTVNAMVNLPIGDKVALRVVGGDTDRSGWIDRYGLNPFPLGPTGRGDVLSAPVQTVVKDVNTEALSSARASLLLQPNDDLSITGMVLYQRMKMDGYDQFQSPPGSQNPGIYQAFNIPEPISDTIKVYSLSAVQNLGFADFTSATSYWQRESKFTQDASENVYYDFGLSQLVPLPYSENDYTRQFTQEIRLSSPEEQSRLRWVVGAFYSDMHALWIQNGADSAGGVIAAQDAATNGGQANPAGIIFESYNPYRIQQMAAFADGSVNITDELKFSTGLRWDRYLSIELNNEWGDGLPTVTPLTQPIITKAAAWGLTPRFNLSYEPSRDLTTYVNVAQGFRPGGANQYVPSFCNAGPGVNSFKPDSLWNYEIGEKAKFFDDRLTVNGDVFYIRWAHIQQLGLLGCGYEYYENAGSGRSFGPEFEVTGRITPEWSFGVNGSYTDAAITSPVPALAENVIANAQAGTISSCPSLGHCTLPILNVPKYSGEISLTYSRPIGQDYLLTSRISDSLVGPVVDESYYPIINLPTYNLVNFRTTFAADKWSAALFVNNLTNKRAELTANNTSFQWNTSGYVRLSTTQPLTAGIDLSYKF